MEPIERKTLGFHLTFSAMDGIAAGVLMSLQEVIAKKALGASPAEVTVLFMSTNLARASAVVFTGFMQKFKSYRNLLFAAGLVRILSLSLVYLVKSPLAFIAAVWLFQLPQGIIKPAQNYILSKNYNSQRRGKLYGYALSITNLFALIASYIAGSLLDINQQYFRYIIPAVGLVSGVGAMLLGLIPTPERKNVGVVPRPFTNMIKIFSRNRYFWRFERNFFIYGFGFLLIGPVVPLFLVDVLNMSYREVSLARGVLAMSVQILLSPFTGKIHDKHNPLTFAGMTLSTLAVFPIMLFISGFMGKIVAYAAFFVRSVGMTGTSIVWNLGSIFFADRDDEATYQAIHLTMTGIRGLTAPILGYISLTFLGYSTTFLLSGALLFFASALMYIDGQKLNRELAAQSLRT